MSPRTPHGESPVLEALADHTFDGMVALDRDLRYVFWNRAMEQMFGMRADDVVGQYVFELFPFLLENGEDDLLRRALLGESVGAQDRPFLVTGTDHRGFYEARYAPYRNGRGEITGVTGIIRDVTEAKATAERLDETESRFRNMADASPVLLWMSGRDALCTFFNQTWLDFTGRPLEQEWGVGWAEGVHPEDFQRCMDTYIAAFGERRIFEMEYRLRRADGEYRWVLDRGTPRYSAGGRFAGYIGSCIDITDRKRAEAELRQAVRARDEFLSIASHELRTPLTALQLQLESLTRTARRAPQEALASGRLVHNATAALGQSERVATLVDVMLDVSRISEGRVPLEYDDVDLSVVTQETVARLARSAAEAGSTVEVRADGIQSGRWDRLRVEQVVTNLLSNAIKYGKGRPIFLSLAGDAEHVRLVVRDHGIGIPRAHQDRIFDRFERAVSPRNYSGFGLGLWICRRIVEALSGEITVESAPDQGATFVVVLPRRPPGSEAGDDLEVSAADPGAAARSDGDGEMRPLPNAAGR